MPDDEILDDLFLGCALTAFLEQAHAQQGWPDMEATRRLAYRMYEDALAAFDNGSESMIISNEKGNP